MEQLFILILGVGLGALGAWLVLNNRKQHADILPPSPKATDGQSENVGLIERQAKEKEEHKQKILEFMEGRERTANDDIQKLLGVSDRTVQRYFNELEVEGKVKQVGETGKGVFYAKS